jgi:hypothetical protein
LLRQDLLVDTAELTLNPLHLMSRGFALLAIQLHRRAAGQAPLSAAHYGSHDLEVS